MQDTASSPIKEVGQKPKPRGVVIAERFAAQQRLLHLVEGRVQKERPPVKMEEDLIGMKLGIWVQC